MSTSARPDYLELPATDLAATKAFYAQVFGWAWQDFGPTYSAATGDGPGPEVALNGEADPAPVHEPGSQNVRGPFALFSTTDLAALEAAVVDAGGRIVSATYPYPGGRRFHFADPSGNVLGAYCSDAPA